MSRSHPRSPCALSARLCHPTTVRHWNVLTRNLHLATARCKSRLLHAGPLFRTPPLACRRSIVKIEGKALASCSLCLFSGFPRQSQGFQTFAIFVKRLLRLFMLAFGFLGLDRPEYFQRLLFGWRGDPSFELLVDHLVTSL